jgi:hypothetical protein
MQPESTNPILSEQPTVDDSRVIMPLHLIQQALRRRHPAPAWAYFAELRTHTGFMGETRYLDGFAMGCWESTKLKRVGYEIKVSRSDWLQELKNPIKRQQGYFLTHEFWFAVAPGVVAKWDTPKYPRADNVPCPDWDGPKAYDLQGCGVLEVQFDGSCKVLRKAHGRKAWPLPEPFIASLLRRVDEDSEEGEKPRDTREPLFRQMALDS